MNKANKKRYLPLLVTLIILFLCVAVTGYTLVSNASPVSTEASLITISPEVVLPVVEVQPKAMLPVKLHDVVFGSEDGWGKVVTFTGENSYFPVPFHISGNEWRISWATDTLHADLSRFDVIVYREGISTEPLKIVSDSGDNDANTIFFGILQDSFEEQCSKRSFLQ